jgi:hypothetical protein
MPTLSCSHKETASFSDLRALPLLIAFGLMLRFIGPIFDNALSALTREPLPNLRHVFQLLCWRR